MYAHTGIADAQPWSHVQAAWNENTDKCRMGSAASLDSAAIVQLLDEAAYRRLKDRETISEDHMIWFLDISPSIREWYGTGDFPVKKIGVVIRNSDGSKKGINADTFCKVTDKKYQWIEHYYRGRHLHPGPDRYACNRPARHNVHTM